MRKYYTQEERAQIEECLKRGLSVRAIAHTINRPFFSVKNELQKNGGRQAYNSETAQRNHIKNINNRNFGHNKWRDLSDEEKKLVAQGLKDGLSMKELRSQLKISYHALRGYFIRNKFPIPKRITTDDLKTHEERISSLEMQLEIVLDELKELRK